MRIDALVLECKPQFHLYEISCSGKLIEKTFRECFDYSLGAF